MNRQTGLFVFAMIVSLANICTAQTLEFLTADDQFGSPGEYIGLLTLAAVQQELKIEPEQLGKLETIFEHAPSMSTESDKSDAINKFEESLQQVLTVEQWARCVELRIQRDGTGSLVRQDVVTKLKLSEKQLEKLRKLRSEVISESFVAGFQQGFQQSMNDDDPSEEELEKLAAASKARWEESMKKCLDVLTPEQRETFKVLNGKPFEFPASE